MIQDKIQVVHHVLVIAVGAQAIVKMKIAAQEMHDAKVQDEALDLLGWKTVGEGPVAQGFTAALGTLRPKMSNEGDGAACILDVVDPRKEEQQKLHCLLLFRPAALGSIDHRHVRPLPEDDHPVVPVSRVDVLPCSKAQPSFAASISDLVVGAAAERRIAPLDHHLLDALFGQHGMV